jgi:pimeloyl-ACP methyl ester carboxylesterase
MSTRHHWFRSGEYSLSGNIDLPESARSQSGVLIVPPFGWEDVCSYRPLRSLGLLFASQGIPAMRFDLPGTGDSSGDALDLELLEAWIRAIGDAAEKLREVSGVRDVAVVGVRMGAVLALAAATRGANVQDLILWGPSASGRSVVRELRAFSKMARAEYSNGAPPPPQPITGLEAGGFLLAPETQRVLEAVDFSALPEMRGRRVLMFSRDELPADAKLVTALWSAGCAVEVQTGNGYAAMMAIPEEALAPAEVGRGIIDFLKRGDLLKGRSKDGEHRVAERTVSANKRLAEIATPVKTSHGTIVETVYRVDRPSGSLFGILSNQRHQIANPEWCVVFLNAGAVRHTGPNRMWVETARRLAVRGVTSLRLDLEGIGESEGEASLDVASLYQDRLVEQVESAMKSLRMNLGVQKFALAGLCSGAFWAFHAALRNPEVRTAILLNPRLFFWDPEIDRRRVLRRTARLLTESTDWGRLMRGYVSVDSLKRVSRVVVDRFRANRARGKRCQISPEGMAEAMRALERNQNRLTIIFTEGEPLLREMEEEGHLSADMNSRLRCIRLANCGHTFRPIWAQASVHELIDRELDAVLNATAETTVYRDMAHQNAEQSAGSLG